MSKSRILSLTLNTSAAAVLFASTTSYAHPVELKENFKGEAMPTCPIELTIHDGLYVGLQGGYDMYRIASEVPEEGFISDDGNPATAFALDPRLFAGGGVAGGFIGYGKYFDNLSGIYLGLEVFGNWSGAQTDYELTVTSNNPGADFFQGSQTTSQYKAEYQVQSNYGIDVIPGIRLNEASLFYLRLGCNWAKFAIDEYFTTNVGTQNQHTVEFDNDSDIVAGFHYGVGIETSFIDHWSIRAEYTHTDFDEIGGDGDDDDQFSSGSDFTPADNQFLLGIIYHFNF